MTPDQRSQFIRNQRAKGVPDTEILRQINTYQPEERGIAGELVPAAFSVAGGILGAAGGSLAAPVAGTVAGGVAGAAAGGALGETVQQGIERTFTGRPSFDSTQIAAQGVVSGASQLVGAGLAKLGGLALTASRPTAVRFLSKLSGYADDVVSRALERTAGAVQATKGGEVVLQDVVKKTAAQLSVYAKQSVDASRKAVAEFSKGGNVVQQGLPGTKSELLNQGKDFINTITTNLRSKYNIGVSKESGLMFDRANIPSNIVSQADRSAIQSAFQTVSTIKNNVTIKHIDAVLERLITLHTKTPAGSPTGAETKLILREMADDVVEFVKSVPSTFGKGYKQYADHLVTELPKRVFIGDAKELFGTSANLSPKEVSLIEKRLLQMFNTGNRPIREFSEEVGKTLDQDIVGTAAGTLINTGDQVSVRATELTKRGIVEKVLQYIPRAAVSNYVSNGKLTPELSGIVQFIAKTTGTTAKVILQDIVNVLSSEKKNK